MDDFHAGVFLLNLMRRFTCATTTYVISVDRKENNYAYNHVLPLLLEFEDTKSVVQSVIHT